MNKKIIPSILLLALLLIPAMATAQSSGSMSLDEEVAIIPIPSWLKATLFTWSSEGKYKVVMTNTGEFTLQPELCLYVFKKGVACPTGLIGDFLAAHYNDIDNNWQLKLTTVADEVRVDWTPGKFCHTMGTYRMVKGESVTWYGHVKSPAGGEFGDYCFVARFKDAITGWELDYKSDVITVTTPEGQITLTFLSLAVIGMSGILISKGAGLW